MDDVSKTLTELHAAYADKVNRAVAADRGDLAEELAAEFASISAKLVRQRTPDDG
jgi:hypothetical protein